MTNERFSQAFVRYFESQPPKLPIRVINNGTSNEKAKLGTIKNLNLALDQLDRNDDIIVTSTDRIFGFELLEPIQFATQCSAPINVCTKRYQRTDIADKYGCVLLRPDQSIIDFEEKPQRPRSKIASLSMYVLPIKTQPLVKSYLLEQRNHNTMGFFLKWLIKKTTVYAFITNKNNYDVNTPNSYATTLHAFSN